MIDWYWLFVDIGWMVVNMMWWWWWCIVVVVIIDIMLRCRWVGESCIGNYVDGKIGDVGC